jgi:hypothetical protein
VTHSVEIVGDGLGVQIIGGREIVVSRPDDGLSVTCRDSVGAPYGMGRVIWLGWQRTESWCRQAM